MVSYLVRSSRPKGIAKDDTRPAYMRVVDIDWAGMVIILGAVTCLVLATTWGPTKGWSDGSVVAPLVVAGVLTIVAIAWEWHKGNDAMIPFSLFTRGTFPWVLGNTTFSRWVMLVPTYYLPIHFEAVDNHSATSAGLQLLGIILSMIITSTVGGLAVRKIGRYTPFLIVGPMLAMIGGGLLYTITPSTNFGNIIGYEILLGTGLGCFFQMGMLGAQAEFAAEQYLMGKVMGVVAFGQMLGGVIGLAVSGSVFQQKLASNLQKYAPGVNSIVASSPTTIRQFVTGDQLAGVLKAYDQSREWAYITLVPVAGVALIFGIFVKDKPLVTPGAPPKAKAEASPRPSSSQAPTAADEGPKEEV